MKKKINKVMEILCETINDRLRWLCAMLSTENRLVVILLLLLGGAILNFYFMFSTINNWTKSDKKGDIRIEHIKTPDMPQTKQSDNFNTYDYEDNEQETEENG